MSIHTLSAVEVRDAIARGELSALQAVEAAIARAEAVEGRVNALCHTRFEAARAEARAADEARAQRGSVSGPLDGVPITLKDNLDLEGTDATLGVKARQHKPSSKNGVVVQDLLDAGAIPIGKTNIPQLLLSQETENAMYGVTRNPWETGRVPGGSSGGEAAAIASGIVPCGVGTDIGGSIRIPSHFCGIAGLKPGLDRWSNRGSNGAFPGQEIVRSQIGPMARRVADLTLMMQTVDPVAHAAQDPRVAPVPFGDPASLDLKGMRIGWFDDDGYQSPTPALRRAVNRAREVLEAAGATLVPFTPPDKGEVLFVWLAAVSADGARTMADVLEGEPPIPQMKPAWRMARLPGAARKAIAAVMERRGEARVSRLLRALGEKPVKAVMDLTAVRTEMVRAEFDAWRAADLSAVICPAHSVPAMAHRESAEYILGMSYLFRYSLVPFPAGVVPVTRVRGDELMRMDGGDRLEKKQAAIDAGAAGLPVGVQVVARPFGESQALRVMSAIEAGVSGDEGYPATPVEPS